MEYVDVEVNAGVAMVTLDRPPVNALNAQAYREIGEAFAGLGRDPDVRVAILRSAMEKIFSAGADIKEKLRSDGPRPLDPGREMRESVGQIYHCAVPVIAAVNGPALGSGFGLVLRSDLIVASERAEFGMTEIDVGLLGGTAILKRMVGPYRMRQMYYLAQRVKAHELYERGGIVAVVPHDRLLEEALAVANQIASKSSVAVRLAKESMIRTEDQPWEDAYRTEQDYTARLRSFDDSAEAMQAFLERRPPGFTAT